MKDDDNEIARALRLAHDTVQAATFQLDRIAEAAEQGGLDISDEIAAARDDLMFALDRYVNAVRDVCDLRRTSRMLRRMAAKAADERGERALH